MEECILSDVNFDRMSAEYYSTAPTLVDGMGNNSFYYYKEELYQLIYSRFVFKNLPKSWDIDYIRDVLFREGIMSICQTDVGVVPLRAGYSGINIYEKPTEMNISNPVLGSFNRTIGIDCVPLYFEYANKTYDSMNTLVNHYALLLAQTEASLNTNLINSRIAMTFSSEDKTVLASARKMYDDVTKGKPALFVLKNKGIELKSETLFNNVKNTYIGNELLITKQTIMNEFNTEIGLNNANTQKRERLIKDEANSNNEHVKTKISMWIDRLNECFRKANELFGDINVVVELRESEEEPK